MRNLVLVFLCMALPFSASAEWVAGVDYFSVSDEDEGVDLNLSGISASIGYKFDLGCNCYLIPSFSYGVGISDDSVNIYGVEGTVEMDKMMGVDVRAQWEFAQGMYLYAAPSYRQVEVSGTVSTEGFAASFSEEGDWEFGLGAGIGYNFNETLGLEAGFERIDTSDVWSVGMRFTF